jgi:hypothetical protein
MQQREWRLGRENAFMARCSITALSLPIEYSITGFFASATTSRMAWMLSASSRCKWGKVIEFLLSAEPSLITTRFSGVESAIIPFPRFPDESAPPG